MSDVIQLLRWQDQAGVHLGISQDYRVGVLPVSAVVDGIEDVPGLLAYCRSQNTEVSRWAGDALQRVSQRVTVAGEQILAPLDLSELWASGVTYEISRDARQEETTARDDFYGRVYDAPRPELFFKAPGHRIVGPNTPVGIRRDATWHVPEPELTVILDDRGRLFGLTIGNDMTARDLEAQNPLYLPQAKMFHHSAALGPTVVLADTVDPYALSIRLTIVRQGDVVVDLTTSTSRLRRSLQDLVAYLGHEWPLAPWTGLMTGTGIVPPDFFALEDGDEIFIDIPEIGTLANPVRRIDSEWAPVFAGGTRVLQIDPRDTVAVALGALDEGQEIVVAGSALTIRDAIPFGHKVAIKPMKTGDWVIKYGERIGMATRDIAVGQHVHVHNVESYRGRGDLVKKGGHSA